MEQNIGGIRLNETVEKIIDFLLEKNMIKPFANDQEKDAVIKNVKEALEGVFENGNVPLALFNNPAQMKKLVLLVVSAAMENHYKKDPAMASVAGLFNPQELAKAMFSPEMDNELAKKTIFNFAMALRPPGPGSRKKCEDLAELMVQQKLTFGDRELHDLAAEQQLDNDLKEELEAYLYKQQEENYLQAYGSTPDGTPISTMGAQRGNSISAQDMYSGGPNDAGYLKIDNDPNSPMMSGELKSEIGHKKLDMGVLDTFCEEMESTLKIASTPRPTPPGTRTS